tara:strand:- start:4808 stop:5902 length:1095 start_codon:yes stop_codon:yes gene_type:complete
MEENRFEELVAKNMGAKIETEKAPAEEVKQEAPKQETATEEKTEAVKEDSSLKTEETPTKTEETPTEEKNTQSEGEAVTKQPSFEELLSEKFDGKYKTVEELQSALSSQSASSEDAFANEQIAKLNEYVAKGGSMEEFFSTQTANYEEMDTENVVKSHMKFKNPELTMEEIGLLYEDTYKLDEDEYTDKEVKLSKIKLKQKSLEARKELMKFQSDNAIPKTAKDAEAERLALEENQANWRSRVNEGLKDFQEVSFDLNDKGDKYTFAVNEDSMKYVKNTTSNLSDFWKRYVKEDGSEDIGKIAREMAILENVDNIVRSAYAQGKSGGKEDVINDIKNPSYTPESKSSDGTPLSIQEQISKQLLE